MKNSKLKNVNSGFVVALVACAINLLYCPPILYAAPLQGLLEVAGGGSCSALRQTVVVSVADQPVKCSNLLTEFETLKDEFFRLGRRVMGGDTGSVNKLCEVNAKLIGKREAIDLVKWEWKDECLWKFEKMREDYTTVFLGLDLYMITNSLSCPSALPTTEKLPTSSDPLFKNWFAEAVAPLLGADMYVEGMGYRWKPIATEVAKVSETSHVWDSEYFYTIVDSAFYVSRMLPTGIRDSMFIVILETPQFSGGARVDCHACGVHLGLITYRRVKGSWSRDLVHKASLPVGSWGAMPDYRFELIGPDTWGLIVEHGYGMGGVYDILF